jgi:transcriptional regulator with XRE-family HTH domain
MYERIKSLRKDKGISQIEIAKILHCSQRVYSNYERGQIDIPTRILIGLSRYYETSIDYILGLTDERRPYKRSIIE